MADSDADYQGLIAKLLHDDALRAGLRDNIRDYVRNQAGWSRIAGAHTKVYHSVVTVPYGKARYIYVPEPRKDGQEGTTS